MNVTDPRGLAARPAFARFLAALRGGGGPCPWCGGGGDRAGAGVCEPCSGSGRVAVPPDPVAGAPLADWWQEQGGTLGGLLWVYAGLAEPCGPCKGGGTVGGRFTLRGLEDAVPCDDCDGTGELPDPCLSAALAAWDGAACPARAAAVRGLRLDGPSRGTWAVRDGGPRWLSLHDAEPAARIALKRAVLACYDPGNPYDGGAGVRIPMRAEGARLTYRHRTGLESALPIDAYESGRRLAPADLADEYRLDGVRVGAPPDWSWTPHRVRCPDHDAEHLAMGGEVLCSCDGAGWRLAVTWEAPPSSLPPAAGADDPPAAGGAR